MIFEDDADHDYKSICSQHEIYWMMKKENDEFYKIIVPLSQPSFVPQLDNESSCQNQVDHVREKIRSENALSSWQDAVRHIVARESSEQFTVAVRKLIDCPIIISHSGCRGV